MSAWLIFLKQWVASFWIILRDTAPFLIVGLFLAGILHILVPKQVIAWALGKTGWKGAVRGALLGIPLPLCSCSVVPTALTLRRQGASLSATTAFTISTPETSVDSIAMTAALLPLAFLGIRPVASLLLAITVGVIVEYVSRKKVQEQLRNEVLRFNAAMESLKDQKTGAPNQALKISSDICKVCGLMTEAENASGHSHPFLARIRAVLNYAFGDLFRDIAGWLIVGLILAALLQAVLPASLFREGFLSHSKNLQVVLAILVGIPLYSCATATTPLVAALLAKGLSPGAGLALLLTGPATNLANVFAFRKEFGTRLMLIYYGSLIALCWLFGIALNSAWSLLVRIGFLPAQFEKSNALPSSSVTEGAGFRWLAEDIPGWIEVGASVVILALTLRWVVKLALSYRKRHTNGSHHDHSHDHVH